ncbi:NUDIX hydrolase [Nocardiopsis sp. RSe5-2]|uniref:NUDIX hydrolase n=1 Tax=Nocardiopsis endophytica TaxID=3018445 RepID=A0ABT4U0B1_9ACTN|nr:NUDIX hydrolase [Nocardiopsis endophytica]MDA2810367.1 NUDIX hydrolase [Nocardiopsis endophytica]
MVKVCDQRTVGVLIGDTRGRLLMIERGTAPVGRAPVAGHWDLDQGADHGTLRTPEDVARAEVREEVGLEVTALHDTGIRDLWVPTWCRRRLPAGAAEPGHAWTVYTAATTGVLTPDERETKGADWYDRDQVMQLAERTANYAVGLVPEEEWQADPGLEPVWVVLLNGLGWLRTDPADLEDIAAAARAGTVTHHDGSTTTTSTARGSTETVHRARDGRTVNVHQKIDEVGPGETVIGMRL